MPVNERGPSLTEAEATNHQLFTYSSGTKPRNRGCNGTVLHDYLFRVPARALVGLRLSRSVPRYLDSAGNGVQNPIRSTWSMPRYFFHFRVEASLFKDENGEVLADASVALQHARRIAAELVHGGESTNAAIVVVEDGRQLFEVRLSECGD